ncbi:hypothetical protein Vretifemale_2313 [Volvox reticuliferus]|nr:hypothetical protein Vretifemale_2313 [Volvox reticuliferus]
MTERLLNDYLAGRTFYGLQQSGEVDNPDQRIASDVANFTDTAMGLALTLLNAGIDLVSFSGILFSIYPPLFAALILYSVGGTAASVALGKNLVTLNFTQEAREADFRYGLVRIRENAESIAFYGGDQDEKELLKQRLQAAVSNYLGLLTASRNLDFFTSFYRYLIQLLPAAVVAPLFFQGKIDFGVINQSQSAFNHILNDVSLVIYQIEALAGFSAVVDRLGEFQEAMTARQEQQARLAAAGEAEAEGSSRSQPRPGTSLPAATEREGVAAAVAAAEVQHGQGLQTGVEAWAEAEVLPGIQLRFRRGPVAAAEGGSGGKAQEHIGSAGPPLLRVRDLTVVTPRGGNLLLRDLNLEVSPGSSLLVMGPSGAGKTSLLRAVAGLWSDGCGCIELGATRGEVMFLPQRPYMVLGSLRDQALYPRRCDDNGNNTPATSAQLATDGAATGSDSNIPSPSSSLSSSSSSPSSSHAEVPGDAEVLKVLELVQLGHLLTRYGPHGHHVAAASQGRSRKDSNGNGSNNGNDNGRGNGQNTESTSAESPGAASASASTSAAAAALDTVADWASSLSLGEQQRLGWARLLLSRPKLALLDEATSALDQDTEARLYKVLEQSGITYISVGHRSTLKEFHRTLLQLRPGGAGGVEWEVRGLADAPAVGATDAAAMRVPAQ